jgi:hypothetical protein
VVRVNDAPLVKSPAATLSLTPLLGRRTRGLMVAVAFPGWIALDSIFTHQKAEEA